jgi:hypothetical protein
MKVIFIQKSKELYVIVLMEILFNLGVESFGLLLKSVNCESKNSVKFDSAQIFAM